MKQTIGTIAAGLCMLLLAGFACAQAYPSRPIHIVVPFTPGGFNDTLGRTLANKMQETWGQPVIVDNKPGAGTVIGTDFVAKSAPDGYTLLIVALPFSVIPSLYPKSGIDVLRDFSPVALAGATPNLLVVNPSVPVNSVRELIALAKSKPGGLSYASTGAGSSNHLSMEMFKSMTGTDLVHVPYKGSAPAVTDLIGGHVMMMYDNLPNVIQQVRANKMRAIAVSSSARSPLAPEVPTVAETVPGYEVTVWFGVVGPTGIPREVVAKLNAEINRIFAMPDVRERFVNGGVDPVGGPPERFGEHLKTEVAKWAKVVKATGARVD
jgi:tripartite-type tricarboxylate transporter receptor subunit TctC